MSGNDSFKVHEFVAHANDVTCISIGHVSNQVLATGGDDNKVNIWRVGKSSNIWSLGGNKKPISSLCFDRQEQGIVSGSEGGSLRVYDLSEGKLARNLKGHMTSITSVDYHPYGDFIVSGSADTNMKVWDVRNKSCIQTYKGHSAAITNVQFSPDGQWVASSANDGQLKIWDITAGKIKHTFRVSSSSISTFAFNPCEFLLAAVTSDRVVKFWDLETFDLLGSSPADNHPIKSITFSHNGEALLTASQDGIKEHHWEPPAVSRHMPVPWQQVDVHCLMPTKKGNQLLVGSFLSSFASIWALELEGLYEYRPAEDEYDPQRALRQREEKQAAKMRHQSDQMDAILKDPAFQKEDELSVMGQGMAAVPAITTTKANKAAHRRAQSDAPLSARNRRTSSSRGNHHSSAASLPERDAHRERAPSTGRRREGSFGEASRGGTPTSKGAPRSGFQDPSPRRRREQNSSKTPLRSMSAGRMRTPDMDVTPRAVSECGPPPGSSGSRPGSNDTHHSSSRSSLISAGQGIIGGGPPTGGADLPAPLRPVNERAQVEFSASGMHEKVHPNRFGVPASPFEDELERFSHSGDYNFQGARKNQGTEIDRDAERRAFEAEEQREREKRALAAEARKKHAQGYAAQVQPLPDDPIAETEQAQRARRDSYPPRSSDAYQQHAPHPFSGRPVSGRNGPAVRPLSGRNEQRNLSSQQSNVSEDSYAVGAAKVAPTSPSDMDVMSELLLHRTTVTLALSTRISQIESLKARWCTGDWSGVLSQLDQLSSPSSGEDIKSASATVCDFLRSVDLHFEALNLDSCIKLFPIVLRIFPTGFESHINTALKVSATLVEMFGEYICDTRYAPRHGAVDITREERIEKCNICYEHMKKLRKEVSIVMQQISKFERAWEIEASCKKLEDFFSSHMLDM